MSLILDGSGTITGATTLASTIASPVFTAPTLGTPASGALTSCTSIPAAQITGTVAVANGGTGVATSTGSGANALATSPTLTTPVLSGSVTGTYTLAGTPTMGASLITSGTAVATTSGTSIDFTGIPSWVKRIIMTFNAVSANGTSNFQIQLGDSGGVEITGYDYGAFNSGAWTNGTNGPGFDITAQTAAAQTWSGSVTITKHDGNTWCSAGNIMGISSGYLGCSGGGKTLSGTLDRVRLTTVNGSDTFDAGSVNILYE